MNGASWRHETIKDGQKTHIKVWVFNPSSVETFTFDIICGVYVVAQIFGCEIHIVKNTCRVVDSSEAYSYRESVTNPNNLVR